MPDGELLTRRKGRRQRMVSERPKVSKDGRYSIRETSQLLGIHEKTLYRHTIAQDIKCERRASNGRPVYLGSEILRYWGASM